MKRIAIISMVLLFAVVISAFSVSAADSYKLIYKDADWQYTDNGGCRVSADFSSGNAVFSGSAEGTWPSTECDYAPDKQIKVKIDDYSLSYDFTVEGGATNISIRFLNADGVMKPFPIANNCLGDVNYDTGSGDLYAGDYKGTIKLTDLVNAKQFFENTPFDKSYVSKDNELLISGVQVYSVNGAKVTVRKLDIVKNASKNDKPTESSTPEVSVSEPDESSEEPDESIVVSDESSEEPDESSEEPSEASDESSEAPVSQQESKDESSESSVAEDDESGLNTGAIVAIVIGCIALAAVVVFVIIKAKKK